MRPMTLLCPRARSTLPLAARYLRAVALFLPFGLPTAGTIFASASFLGLQPGTLRMISTSCMPAHVST